MNNKSSDSWGDKKTITPNSKNINEIIDYLYNKFTLSDISEKKLDYFTEKLLKSTIVNLKIHMESTKQILDNKNIKFKIYLVSKDEKSKIYFKKSHSFDNYLRVIIEENTRYIESESSLLKNDLYLYRGITQYDIDNDTPDFKSYLFFIDYKKRLSGNQ